MSRPVPKLEPVKERPPEAVFDVARSLARMMAAQHSRQAIPPQAPAGGRDSP